MVHSDAKAAPVTVTTWSSAGGLSVMNAIGTQLCDPINSGKTRRRIMAVYVINK